MADYSYFRVSNCKLFLMPSNLHSLLFISSYLALACLYIFIVFSLSEWLDFYETSNVILLTVL